MPGEATAEPRLEPSRVEVDLVVDDQQIRGLRLEEPDGGTDGASGFVHVRLRLQERDARPVETMLRQLAGEPRAKARAVAAGELVAHHEADVVPRRGVLSPRIPEARDEQVERRGALAPTEEPHREGLFLALDRAGIAGCVGAGFGGLIRCALRPLVLRHVLEIFGLGLVEHLLGELDARRLRHAREHRLGIVEERDPVGNREIARAQVVADRERRDVRLDPVGNLHRQRLDVHLAPDLGQHTAHGDALGVADEVDDDGRLDRLVEANLVEVDVEQPRLGRMELVVLEDRVVGLLSVAEHDVENRVRPMLTGEDASELALGDAERVRLAAVSVEDARNEPLRAQASRLRAPPRLTLLDLELDSLSRHSGGPVYRNPCTAPEAGTLVRGMRATAHPDDAVSGPSRRMPHDDDKKAVPANRSKTPRPRTAAAKRSAEKPAPEPPVVRLEIYAAAAPVKHAKPRRRKTESTVRPAAQNGRGSAALDAREAALAEREATLAACESKISERETRIADAESALNEREARLATAETELSERERRAAALTGEADARHGRVVATEADLAERERTLASREAEIASDAVFESQRNDLERRERRVAEMEETLPERVRDLDEREMDFETLRARVEADLELREVQLEDREEALEERERRVAAKETELVAYVAQVQGELRRRELQASG